MQSVGDLFAIFDQQDSGNIAYGVSLTRQVGDHQRYFVKTAVAAFVDAWTAARNNQPIES